MRMLGSSLLFLVYSRVVVRGCRLRLVAQSLVIDLSVTFDRAVVRIVNRLIVRRVPDLLLPWPARRAREDRLVMVSMRPVQGRVQVCSQTGLCTACSAEVKARIHLLRPLHLKALNVAVLVPVL